MLHKGASGVDGTWVSGTDQKARAENERLTSFSHSAPRTYLWDGPPDQP